VLTPRKVEYLKSSIDRMVDPVAHRIVNALCEFYLNTRAEGRSLKGDDLMRAATGEDK
jgi:hypothetical protein